MEESRSLAEAVYTAEAKVLKPIARKFSSIKEIESYVENIVSSDWWSLNFPNAPVYVEVEKRSNSARFALAVSNTIVIPNSVNARTAATVLHELSHIATLYADGHGPIFRSAMLKLVRYHIGFYQFVDLQNQYKKEFLT